jgi:hypothetical protein
MAHFARSLAVAVLAVFARTLPVNPNELIVLAADALPRIAETKTSFIPRGDQSPHARAQLAMWKRACAC